MSLKIHLLLSNFYFEVSRGRHIAMTLQTGTKLVEGKKEENLQKKSNNFEHDKKHGQAILSQI